VSPPVFIVACDRSGTTLLRLILDRSLAIAIPTESMFLADVGARRQRYGELETDAQFDRLVGDIWRHPKVRQWGLSSPPPQRDGRTGQVAYRAAIEAPFAAYAAEHNKPRWGDKTPYYISNLDEIKRVFPDALIVNLVRDGRDVCLSLLSVPFGPANVWAAAHQWRSAVVAGDAASARYGDDVLTLRYEDMVTRPAIEVGRVCRFVGIPFEPSMLEADADAHSRVAAGQEAWFVGLSESINVGSVGRWRTEMSRRDQALFTSIAGDALRRHAYDVPDTGGPPPIPDAAQAAHNWTLKLWHFTTLHVVQERGREVPHLMRRRLRR
jgi:hypothetical protein